MLQKPKKKETNLLKTCARCNGTFTEDYFCKSNSLFHPDGLSPICNECIREMIEENMGGWDIVNKLCQYLDIPFLPSKVEELSKDNDNFFPVYCSFIYSAGGYQTAQWEDYNKKYLELEKEGKLENELPLLGEEIKRELIQKWGPNYDDEALQYLEQLYSGLLATQNVNGSLQSDQALKICKISYELDCRIREGADFDKLLSSYDKLIKAADFTPKNTKNANDFDSVGELVRWLERRGYKNNFYDDVTRDIVDETIKNIQNYNRGLYINESGIGDEITRRIDALKSAKELENYYGVKDIEASDTYDNDGFVQLMEDEDFKDDIDE